MDRIGETLGGTLAADETLTPRFSPGYGDFPLSYQRVLIDLLDAPRVLGVSVTPSDLLVPVKSVTAVVGIRKIS
jgi:cobalamin-dependent methionine synthase I